MRDLALQSNSQRRWLLSVLLVAVAVALGALGSLLPGIDYRPLIMAARLLAQGKSAYGPEMDAFFVQIYDARFAGSGFAYPLPALWMILPFAWLPDALAKALWCIFSVSSVFVGLYLLRMRPALFFFVPVLWGIAELQNTVPLIGLLMIGIWAYEQRRWNALAVIIALTIAAKPQATLLISSFLAFQTWRAGHWRLLTILIVLTIGLPFLFEPLWVVRWIDSARTYSRQIPAMWFWSWTPVGIWLCWRRQWWLGLALLQVALFPIVRHHYALLPLLAGYRDVQQPRQIWLVVACSWLSVGLAFIAPLWLTLVVGYLLPVIIVGWQTAVLPQTEATNRPSPISF